MTTRPIVSLAQLEVLEAAAAGVLLQSQQRGYAYAHWRIEHDVDIYKPVTRTADSLLVRGLIAKGPTLQSPDGIPRIRAVVTDAGRALLDELASREPHTNQPKGTPHTGTSSRPHTIDTNRSNQ